MKSIEPYVAGISGIYCPETGIVDYSEVCRILVSELKKKILYQASIYKKENDKKNFKPYDNTSKPDRKKKKKKN